jgi:hypothetical protein
VSLRELSACVHVGGEVVLNVQHKAFSFIGTKRKLLHLIRGSTCWMDRQRAWETSTFRGLTTGKGKKRSSVHHTKPRLNATLKELVFRVLITN